MCILILELAHLANGDRCTVWQRLQSPWVLSLPPERQPSPQTAEVLLLRGVFLPIQNKILHFCCVGSSLGYLQSSGTSLFANIELSCPFPLNTSLILLSRACRTAAAPSPQRLPAAGLVCPLQLAAGLKAEVLPWALEELAQALHPPSRACTGRSSGREGKRKPVFLVANVSHTSPRASMHRAMRNLVCPCLLFTRQVGIGLRHLQPRNFSLC